jgi:peptidoglycan/LPS O-acetylase OafA/YrhL
MAVIGRGAAVALLIALATAPTSGHTMYEGRYLLVAVVVAVFLARIVLVPGGAISAVLASRPLVATGKVSYGLYLWHWPLLLLITTERTGLSGFELFTARAVASGLAAYLSYVLIERRFH